MQKWKVGGVDLKLPYMFGAGVCKTPESTAQWIEVAPVVSGSYTMEARAGNSGKVLWPETLEEFLDEGYGLNNFGMPNEGVLSASHKLASLESEYPLIVSVAGFNLQEFVAAAKILAQIDNVDAVEFNLGCPNTESEIFSFNLRFVESLLSALADMKFHKSSWFKLSPFSNPAEIKYLAKLFGDFNENLEMVVVTCNTMPNCYAGKGRIDSVTGQASMSGKFLKPRSVGATMDFRSQLDSSIDICSMGGITVADDILDFLDAGAAAVGFTSIAYWAGNPSAFNDHFFSEQNASRFFDFMKDNI